MTESEPRSSLAIIYNSVPPYRVHVHQRIVKELPWLKLWTVRDHEEENRWHAQLPPEINPVSFGGGVSCTEQGRLKSFQREWRNAGRIIAWLRAERVGAVVLGGYNDIGRLRILVWCRHKGIPCFIAGDSNIRGDFASGAKLLLKRLVLGRMLAWSSGALPCGTLGAEYFMKYGMARAQIFFYPVEPDYDLIASISSEQVMSFSQNFGLHPARRYMLYSGRLAAVKRVDLLIDAFAAIAGERVDWDVIILGDGPLREELTRRVPAHLAGRFIWTGHVRDQQAVSALYRRCDVLVLPSDYEPWALVVNEAAAAGMAIVCSDVVGAAAELVQEGGNGHTFSAGNLQGLIKCLMDTTDPAHIEIYQRNSPDILRRWIERGDPVKGLRSALARVGLREEDAAGLQKK